MPALNIVAGDLDYDENGHHVFDAVGFATRASEPKTVELSQEDYDRVIPQLEFDRVNNRGLNTDGSIPE
jgi:nitrogen-specific signal transduction histidine kinase